MYNVAGKSSAPLCVDAVIRILGNIPLAEAEVRISLRIWMTTVVFPVPVNPHQMTILHEYYTYLVVPKSRIRVLCKI